MHFERIANDNDREAFLAETRQKLRAWDGVLSRAQALLGQMQTAFAAWVASAPDLAPVMTVPSRVPAAEVQVESTVDRRAG